ncbi:MAG TPA: flagellar hook-basal body complex protein [Oscillatoriaceae cyanobacterium]
MSLIQPAVVNSLGAVDQWMKTVSANISGSVVNGYRGTEVQFGDVLDSIVQGPIKATNGFGSVDPVEQSNSGIRVEGTTTDFSQGSITQTTEPTNLAINGDGFFVLSKSPVPADMSDLVFTRDGNFHFEFLNGPVAGSGTWRLVNQDGYFVQGWNTPITAANPQQNPPLEGEGTDLNAFDVASPNTAGQPAVNTQMQNIQLDMVRNPNASNNWTFDQTGFLQVNNDMPRDLANNPANMYVSIAKFANPQALERVNGGPYFTYNTVAGEIFAGTAGNPNNNNGATPVVGSSNTLTASALENSNTSINTVMPELTLAQKTFSATTKIMSVANGMIDDVNQLVK